MANYQDPQVVAQRCRKALLFYRDGYTIEIASRRAKTSPITVKKYLEGRGKTLADYRRSVCQMNRS